MKKVNHYTFTGMYGGDYVDLEDYENLLIKNKALKKRNKELENNIHDLLIIKRLLKIDYSGVDAAFEFRFYDLELTKINWATLLNLKK